MEGLKEVGHWLFESYLKSREDTSGRKTGNKAYGLVI